MVASFAHLGEVVMTWAQIGNGFLPALAAAVVLLVFLFSYFRD